MDVCLALERGEGVGVGLFEGEKYMNLLGYVVNVIKREKREMDRGRTESVALRVDMNRY